MSDLMPPHRLRRGHRVATDHRLSLAAVAGLVVLAGCGSSSVGTSSGNDATPGPAATVSEGPGGVQAVDVTGTAQITFDPTRIVVHPGKVEVAFTVPPGSAPHSFTLTKLGVTTGVFSDSRKTVSFTVTKPGTYTFTCDIHANMTGQLVVTQ